MSNHNINDSYEQTLNEILGSGFEYNEELEDRAQTHIESLASMTGGSSSFRRSFRIPVDNRPTGSINRSRVPEMKYVENMYDENMRVRNNERFDANRRNHVAFTNISRSLLNNPEIVKTVHIPSISNKFDKYILFKEERKNTIQSHNDGDQLPVTSETFFRNFRNSYHPHITSEQKNTRLNNNGIFRQHNPQPEGFVIRPFSSEFRSGRESVENPRNNNPFNRLPVNPPRFTPFNLMNRAQSFVSTDPNSFRLMEHIILGLPQNMNQNHTRPLKQDEFKRMTEGKYSELYKTHKLTETVCTVCMSNFENNDIIKLTNCNHIFHPICLNDWIEENHSCPVCRAELGDYEIKDGNTVIKSVNMNSNENIDNKNNDDKDDDDDELPPLEEPI
jgi:hypothetical protein